MDRIGCWIRLGYPDKETEIEILRVNAPAHNLSESIVSKIYEIVNETRYNKDLEIPASPRAGIFLTRLINKYIKKFENEDEAIRFFAPSVLAKEMRVKTPGKTVESVIEEILQRYLG